MHFLDLQRLYVFWTAGLMTVLDYCSLTDIAGRNMISVDKSRTHAVIDKADKSYFAM